MPRNLDRRVEALVPVEDPLLQARLEEVLAVNLADDTLAWTLGPDGDWTHVPRGGTVETHAAPPGARRRPGAPARLTPPSNVGAPFTRRSPGALLGATAAPYRAP